MASKNSPTGSPSQRGAMSRRELLSTATMAVVGARSGVAGQAPATAASAGLVKLREINHINIHVHNFALTERFYRRMFGFAPLQVWGYRVDWPVVLGFLVPPDYYISFMESDTGGLGKSGRIDHFGLGSEPYDRARMEKEIEPLGMKRTTYDRTYSIIKDPDGIGFQVSPSQAGTNRFHKSMLDPVPGKETPSYEVSGPQDLKRIRNSTQEYPAGVTKPQANGLGGVHIYSANLNRSEQFYKTLFGVRFGNVRLGGRSIGVGFTIPSGQHFTFEENARAAGQIAHFRVFCTAFDANRMAKEVEPLAPKRSASDKAAGIFRDPDGIGILLDTSNARNT